jgi:hypothetical protein
MWLKHCWDATVLTALATLVIAGATIFYTYYAQRQWHAMDGQLQTMQGQLNEMKSASEQTERAITASNRIAEATGRSVAASNRLADAAAQATTESRRLADAATQANDVSRQLVDAAAQANAVSKRLADTAAQGNDINRRALIDVQRAFMFPRGVDLERVTSARLTGDLTGTKPIAWQARVKWENSGNTPTKNLIISTNCVTTSGPVAEPYTITATDEQKGHFLVNNEVAFVFGPKQMNYAGPCVLHPIIILFHQLDWLHFYVYGSARYRDVIDPETIHLTEYCFELLIRGNYQTGYYDVQGVPPLSSTASFCAKHNCADDECDKERRISSSETDSVR